MKTRSESKDGGALMAAVLEYGRQCYESGVDQAMLGLDQRKHYRDAAMQTIERLALSETMPALPLNIDSSTRYFALPEPLINLLQSTLGYYASMDTYIGERTGGVLQGCPRGAPDIHQDMGKHAGTAYSTLVKMYPLREVPPTTKGA